MSNLSGYGMSLNTGTYFGSGYTNPYSGNSLYGNKAASNMNLTRISRDIAQGYNQNLQIIDLYLQQGKINKALAMYDSLFESVRDTSSNYGYELSDGQISSIVNQAYLNTTGNSFINSVDNETHSPFVTGLAEGIPVIGLFVNGNSNTEALSKISGTKTETVDKVAEGAGAVLTNAASYALLAGAFSGGTLAIPGAIIGAAVGIGKCLFKGN